MHGEIEEKILLVRERCTENRETMVINLKKDDAGFTKINQIFRIYAFTWIHPIFGLLSLL